MRTWGFALLGLGTVALSGCYKMHWGTPSASGANGALPDESSAARGSSRSRSGTSRADAGLLGVVALPASAPCAREEQVPVEVAGQVDLLFIVDNSDSMIEEQAALQRAFPSMAEALITGDRDGDGMQDFPPVADLHLGVVTTDMGLPGIDGIFNCTGLGDDGILDGTRVLASCGVSDPRFIAFVAGQSDPKQTADDFACIAAVDTGGCGYEQPLESGLKALWPAKDPMANPKTGQNRIQFLRRPDTGLGAEGHGDNTNAGFLRADSLLGIVLLSDEDDCSMHDTRPFTPPTYLDPNDPIASESMNLRCYYHPDALYPVERYVNGWKALRPGLEDQVVFAAITGVPPDLVSADALARIDFTDAAQRDRFYANLLDDKRMQQVVDDHRTPDPSDDRLLHSCMSTGGTADPPRRTVRTAQLFGQNGVVQSICQADFRPALDVIVAKLGTQLATRCVTQ